MSSIAALLPLFRQLNDLKRIRVAARQGSLAERIFVRSWVALILGEQPLVVAQRETLYAVIATRLAGIDLQVLMAAGLGTEESSGVIDRAFKAAIGALPPEFATTLADDRGHFNLAYGDSETNKGALPEFAQRLIKQPRAGATRPGFGRVVLEPTENHAEHCAIVAVQGVLASSITGASPEKAFLTGLCHHLHNAYLPDAGDAGDALLGEHLKPIMATFREKSLSQLAPELQQAARDSLDNVFRADTSESRAFQIADSLDRVLEMEWHARSASFTLSVALEEMDIIHPGPVQAYQLEIMREAGFK